MRHLLLTTALAVAFSLPALCQTLPRLSQDGIPMATAVGRSLLAADASLVFIGAIGDDMFEMNGMQIPLRFNLNDGTATAWVYQFYSPSKDSRVLVAAVDIPSLGLNAFEAASPVPIPELTQPLATDLTYAGSDRMIERLKSDSTYQRYRSDYPSTRPATLALRPLVIDDRLVLPNDFPMEGFVWNLNFTGSGDGTMTCYVDAATGRTFCMRAAQASSVPHEEEGMEGMELSRR